MTDLDSVYRESGAHLKNRLLPFWSGLRDEINGGFYGLVTDDLTVHKEAEKGCILNSRILWFFSETYRALGEEEALVRARHAFSFFRNAFLDKEKGGVYWSVRADGTPADDSKHCYCHAFAVYALAAYAQAESTAGSRAVPDGYSENAAEEALALAHDLFEVIEEKLRDADGYLEAFARDFTPVTNEKLSENGVEAQRTMNTALHVLEAYTELYLADGREETKEKICSLISLFLDKIYMRDRGRLGVFFDREYRSLIDLYSYGHDIEAAWLIDRAIAAVKDYAREGEAREMTRTLTASVYREAYRADGDYASLPAECERGVVEETRIWWVQAEAVNGFLNGMQASAAMGEFASADRYAEAVVKLWAFIRDKVIDPREDGEWFWSLDISGAHDHSMPAADEWKCPYHNGRMCMEIMRRIGKEE